MADYKLVKKGKEKTITQGDEVFMENVDSISPAQLVNILNNEMRRLRLVIIEQAKEKAELKILLSKAISPTPESNFRQSYVQLSLFTQSNKRIRDFSA